MIKVEFFTSPTLSNISRDANLLFVGLWTICDDFGVCLHKPLTILANVFPLREDTTKANIEKWVGELIDARLVIPVEHAGKPLLIVRNWDEHQHLSRPNQRRWLQPKEQQAFIESTCKLHANNMQVACEQHVNDMPEREREREREKETEQGTQNTE